MINKRLINTGEAAPAPFDPLQNFQTVTYTGNGGTQKINGYIRKGAAFNGSSSKINISSSPFNLTTYSLSFWINASDYNQSNASVINIGLDNTGGTWGGLAFGVNANKVYYFGGDAAAGGFGFFTQTGTTNITNGNWHNVVMIVNGTLITGYINGVQDTGLSRTLGANITYRSGSLNTLGVRQGGFGTYGYWNGSIDQVRIFNTALTSTDVATLYAETGSSSTKSTTDIFGDGSGVALYELEGNANDTGGNYNGTATNVNYLGMAFQPDLVWIKNRDYASGISHQIFDSVRGDTSGAGGALASNSANAEYFDGTKGVYSFDLNGFSVDGGINGQYGVNGSVGGTYGSSYVAWCFKAGGAAVSNTDGTITSDVSANQDAGFSIVKYTGGNSSSDTVGHGLTDVEMIILKDITDGTNNWRVWHKDLSSNNWMYLNLTLAEVNAATDGGIKKVTSDTFGFINGTTGTVEGVNSSASDYIAYCFHSVAGHQMLGSYSGNSGTRNISVDFQARWIMIKATNASLGWYIFDSVRHGSSVDINEFLLANSSNPEGASGTVDITFESNNIKIDSASGAVNATGNDYIYLAIA